MTIPLPITRFCSGTAALALAALVTTVGCGGGGATPSSSPTTPDPTGATEPSAGTGGSAPVGGGGSAPAGGDGSAPAGGPAASTCPLGPQLTIDTSTLPTCTGTTWTPHSSSDLTSALAGAAPGDEIVLDATVTYTGPFYLKPQP